MLPNVLRHAQNASSELASSVHTISFPILSKNESAESWLKIEQLLFSCLITGDDASALACLQSLESRFGVDNERIQGLRGVYEEATAPGREAENVLKRYESSLKENPANISLAKRKIALLRSLGRDEEAATTLCKLLDLSPIDVEAWAELADLYNKRTMYKQAVFCLEEILLVQANAWNIHSRIGEISLKLARTAGTDKQTVAGDLVRAVHHFCRSIELCDGYVRGYCGLIQSTSLLRMSIRENPTCTSRFSAIETEKLQQFAVSRTRSIIQEYSTASQTPADIRAARSILDTYSHA